MKRFIIASCFALSCFVGVEAAPTDVVTQADLTELLTRLSRLEAENKAQAQRIAEQEASQARWSASLGRVLARRLVRLFSSRFSGVA